MHTANNIVQRLVRLFVMLGLGLLMPSMACGSAGMDYTGIIGHYQNLPVRIVAKEAMRCEKAGKTDMATVLYMIVANHASEMKTESDKEICAYACLKIGDASLAKADYAKALEAYIDGLNLCESTRKQKNMALFFNNIGKLYCLFEDFEKGEEYFIRGYEICKDGNDDCTKRKIVANLTGLNLKLGRLSKARGFQSIADHMKPGGDFASRFMSGFNGALIAASEGHSEWAASRFRQLAAYAAANGEARYQCSAYQELYHVYTGKQQPDSVRKYLALCWRQASDSRIQHQFVEVLNDYSLFYEKHGNRPMAQKYKSRYLLMSDSIYNSRRFDIARNALSRYEMQKVSREITRLRYDTNMREQTIKVQRMVLWCTLVGIVVVLGFLVLLWRQNRRLQQSYASLYSVNRKAMEEQEAMRRRHADDIAAMEAMRQQMGITAEDGGTQKYSTSNLNDSCRNTLAEAITDVMENTETFCSADFSLEKLSELVGSNSKYVSQVINDVFKKNFSSYVNDYRIMLACRRLVDSAYDCYTIKAISESLGYGTHASFINAFRKATGLTPSQYKKISSGKNDNVV